MDNNKLGEMEHLPFSVNSLKFATSRSVEIAAMNESILRPSKTKLIFQTLPVHMRRRVMSHNTKRLPRKLREGHLEQLKKSGLPPRQKRPSRKYRRRPTNLKLEYERRQQVNKWLETHIWHAKRFHIITRWGYRLPYAPCDKAFRACYRASSAHCLLQDMSYYVPIRIQGPEDDIKNFFEQITSCHCCLGITAKAYITGSRQGSIHIFHKNKYPLGYIGKLTFLWEPNSTSDRILWLFVHPSQSNEIETLLHEVKGQNDSFDSLEIPMKKIKLENENAFCQVEIKSHPGLFNRFRLTGPLSHAILLKSLKCIPSTDTLKDSKWYSKKDAGLNLNVKNNYWQLAHSLNTPCQLPPNIILGLIVKDPRLSRPNIRTKAILENNEVVNPSDLIKIPKGLSSSPIWDLDLHKSLKANMLSNSQFIEHVTKSQLVPGEVNQDDPQLQAVPVVLVQQPGSQEPGYKKLGYGSSWDIIIPSGYGLPFWQTFIMFGGRAGGIRETESLAFERGECYLPPDSKAGLEEEARVEELLKEKYFNKPPSKRINFTKLGVNSPFRCQWKLLLKDWCSKDIDDFYVLRDRTQLDNLQNTAEGKHKALSISNADTCLVPIYVQMVKKGKVARNAMICLPKVCDLQATTTISEPHHVDANEPLRKQAKINHKKELKQKRRKSIKLKKKGTVVKTPKEAKKVKGTPSKYVQKMRELWLPKEMDSVRLKCSRELMGYLSQAAFSFTEAKSCGVGYIAYNALKALLDCGFDKVLIRNTTSTKYRWASFKVIKP